MMVKSQKGNEVLGGTEALQPAGGGTGEGKQTVVVWPLCLAESWAEKHKSFSTTFHFSQEALDKISATYVEVQLPYTRLAKAGGNICSVINQLTCGMKLLKYLAIANIKGAGNEERGTFCCGKKNIHFFPARYCPSAHK